MNTRRIQALEKSVPIFKGKAKLYWYGITVTRIRTGNATMGAVPVELNPQKHWCL